MEKIICREKQEIDGKPISVRRLFAEMFFVKGEISDGKSENTFGHGRDF